METVTETKVTRNVLISVHGIRTFGQWQGRLARLVRLADPEAATFSYHYGFFSVLAFLVPPLRGIEIARFRRHLQRIVNTHPHDRISIVGHSFGTHLIGWALAKGFKTNGMPFHQIILAGSVLRSTFDWHELIDRGLVRRVINDCGTDDNVLLLSQVGVLFTGMAGRLGFIGTAGRQLSNRYFSGGHSHYFVDANGQPDDAFMSRYWLPLLVQSGDPEEVDQRPIGGALQGVYVWMIQNADVVKVGVLLSVGFLAWQMLYATPRALAKAESLSRARAVALQQISVDEQTPQGVANLLSILERDPGDATSRELASRWLSELESYSESVNKRGLPALMVWNGRNLLVTKGASTDLGGSAIETYGFSRDGSQLVTFDANRTIRLFQVSDAKQLVSIPTRMELDKSVASEPLAEPSNAKVFESITAVLGATNPQAESLTFLGELDSIDFRESPDGTYLWGVGGSAAESAGMSERVLFAVNRRTLAYAFWGGAFDDVRFLMSDKRVRAFVTYRPDVPEMEHVDQNPRSPEAMMELRWPEKSNGFIPVGSEDGKPTPPLPKALIEQVTTHGKEDLRLLSIGSMARNHAFAKLGKVGTEEDEPETPVLIYPNLRPAYASWVISERPREDMSLFSAALQYEIPRVRALTKEESKIVHRQLRAYVQKNGEGHMPAMYLSMLLSENDDDGEVTLASRGSRVAYLLRGADGAKFGVTLFCLARDISSTVDSCDYIRARGNFGSVAMSDDGRFLAGGDFAGLGQPGIHLRDLASNRELEPNEQPTGGVTFLTFAPGEANVFASTPYGVWQYSLGNDAAHLVRRFELPGRAAELAKSYQDYGRQEIRVSATQLFHVSSEGVVQALSRKTGRTDWLVRLPVSNAQIVFDPNTQVLAVYGDQCVHLMHAPTGARLARPLCVGDVGSEASKDSEQEKFNSARFRADGVLNVYTDTKQISRKLLISKEATIAVVEERPFYFQWLARLGLASAVGPETKHEKWIAHTGYDHRESPVRALGELPGQK